MGVKKYQNKIFIIAHGVDCVDIKDETQLDYWGIGIANQWRDESTDLTEKNKIKIGRLEQYG